MKGIKSISMYNGQSVEQKQIPELPQEVFRKYILDSVDSGCRLASMSAVFRKDGTGWIYAVIADEESGKLSVVSTSAEDSYVSLANECPQASLFEREMAEQWGIRPEGHPWLKPVRFHRAYREVEDVWKRDGSTEILPSVTDFLSASGIEMHEVAVGPVHAGVIEPGHFRFLCHGEHVYHLEISLGYQHRGIERSLIGGPDHRTVHLIETAAGDTTVGHTTAFCSIMESLTGTVIPPRAHVIRAVALELERLANHTGDIGALAGDVGYLPTASFCGRIRGDLLNMSAAICGNRFSRGLIRPGGVVYGIDRDRSSRLLDKLAAVSKDLHVAISLLWDKPSVMARFGRTGIISAETCLALGIVGPAARASGIERDVRFNFPSGIYQFSHIPVSTHNTGDVFSRAFVRWLEIQASLKFVIAQLEMLSGEEINNPVTLPLQAQKFSVSLVEGWRGEICHTCVTDESGRIAHYKIVDPSFHNWVGLSMALRDQQISDFPLCNKSFNLSYCGHDL